MVSVHAYNIYRLLSSKAVMNGFWNYDPKKGSILKLYFELINSIIFRFRNCVKFRENGLNRK